MLSWVGVTVTMLASPPEGRVAQRLSPDVLSSTLVAARRPERTAQAQLEGWLTNLAVVRPRGGYDGAQSAMLLFVAVAPVGRHSVGLQVIGSF